MKNKQAEAARRRKAEKLAIIGRQRRRDIQALKVAERVITVAEKRRYIYLSHALHNHKAFYSVLILGAFFDEVCFIIISRVGIGIFSDVETALKFRKSILLVQTVI